MPKLVSLFSGAGGMDLGLEAAGFETVLCVENDRHCQTTLRANRPNWKLAEPADIFELRPADIMKQAGIKARELDLLAGGPPCQPFSKAGYWLRGDSLRLRDPRARTLGAYTKIVEALLPKVILLENVEGIQFSEKDEGIRLLKRHLRQINRRCGTRYDPVIFSVNAAEFGVPQIRKRVLLVAARNGKRLTPPTPTHGEGRIGYITAWDALADLEDEDFEESLSPKGAWTALLPSIPEGENYLWHTDRGGGRPLFGFRTRFWSFLLKLSRDKPSWTIPAQPGPATGPFHWNDRLLAIRELARLQTFPDDFEFPVSRQFAQKQLGNAVPPLLAEIVGREIMAQLLKQEPTPTKFQHAIPKSSRKIEPIKICPIPRKYVGLVGSYAAHPGAGRGPGAVLRQS